LAANPTLTDRLAPVQAGPSSPRWRRNNAHENAVGLLPLARSAQDLRDGGLPRPPHAHFSQPAAAALRACDGARQRRPRSGRERGPT